MFKHGVLVVKLNVSQLNACQLANVTMKMASINRSNHRKFSLLASDSNVSCLCEIVLQLATSFQGILTAHDDVPSVTFLVYGPCVRQWVSPVFVLTTGKKLCAWKESTLETRHHYTGASTRQFNRKWVFLQFLELKVN